MVEYRFTLEDGSLHTFKVDLDRAFDFSSDADEHAFWTELKFNQCTNCPLSNDEFRHCPAALDLEDIVRVFEKILSYQKVNVEVRTPERTYSKHCDAQTALTSLVGLVMATGRCPILSKLKGLASFHLPFATMEETVFRTTGAYLLSQYFQYKQGHPPDLDLVGLDQLYQELQIVNKGFKKRIDAASEKDANMNAIASLYALSAGVAYSLEDQLMELKSQFSRPFPTAN